MVTFNLKEIIIGCYKNDEEAMTKLYEYSSKKIRWQLRKIGMDSVDADDIVQETMLRVYEKLSQLRDFNCYGKWLYLVTKSVYCLQFKKQKVYSLANEMESIAEYRSYMIPQNCLNEMDMENIIQTKLVNLKQSMKEVIILRYLKEMSEEEISDYMNIPKGTVKSRLYYARQHIQDSRLIV